MTTQKINLGSYTLQATGNLDAKGRPVFRIPRVEVKALYAELSSGGKVVSATFRKKNGDLRTMVGRKGAWRKAVEANRTGRHRDLGASFPQYETVLEMAPAVRTPKGRIAAVTSQFRNFNLDTLSLLKGQGHVFEVEGPPCYSR